ncbi:MAG: MarR family transcriptional regulator [Bacteroidia bacterium]|nr:MarR family transcriptional regulator [Bacteroidia bacterium]
MRIEQEIQTEHFSSELQKTQLNILFTASWLRARINQALKPWKLSHEQFNVLRILRGADPAPLCVRDITARMLDRNSNTTRILDKLALKGLISRAQADTDRRELDIRITSQGLSLLDQMDQAGVLQQIHQAGISGQEAHLLGVLLDQMRHLPDQGAAATSSRTIRT